MNDRTMALAIQKRVKEAVSERDSVDGWPCCVWCGQPAPIENRTAFSCAHFIPRSQGGLGVEENILTLCPKCHALYDQSEERKKMGAFFKYYLGKKHGKIKERDITFAK